MKQRTEYWYLQFPEHVGTQPQCADILCLPLKVAPVLK